MRPASVPAVSTPVTPLAQGPLPLYFQLAQRLEQQIRSGALPPGEALPTEETLCTGYGISRITVRRALDELHAQGLIVRRRGVGCFVSEPPDTHRSVSMVGSLHEALRFVRGMRYSRFAKTTVVPPEWAAQALGLAEGERAVKVRVVGSTKIGKMVSSEVYYPPAVGRLITREDVRDGTPLIRVVETRLGRRCARAEQFVDPAAASPEVAQALGIAPGTPLLAITRVYRLDDGTAVEAVLVHYHPVHYRLHIDLTVKGASGSN